MEQVLYTAVLSCLSWNAIKKSFRPGLKNLNQTMENKKDFGNKGEESAASFLCGKGFTIIGRNVHVGHYEFDIIAKNDTHIVFAEVKTRHTYPDIPHKFGRPASAVNYDKKHKLIEGAKKYLKKHKTDVEGLMCRIDIIEVYVSPDSEKYKVLKIVHMPNAVRGS